MSVKCNHLRCDKPALMLHNGALWCKEHHLAALASEAALAKESGTTMNKICVICHAPCSGDGPGPFAKCEQCRSIEKNMNPNTAHAGAIAQMIDLSAKSNVVRVEPIKGSGQSMKMSGPQNAAARNECIRDGSLNYMADMSEMIRNTSGQITHANCSSCGKENKAHEGCFLGSYSRCVHCNAPLIISRPNATSSAIRYDQDKLDWSLVPMQHLEGMVRVLMFGTKKYAPHNWRKGFPPSRITNSLQRHLNAFNAGEDIDPESGLPHTAHILCNALFLAGNQAEHPEMDDRYKPEPTNHEGLERQ